jgi:hypothetical protein
MITATHSIDHHTVHANGIFGGNDTSFSTSYSRALIKRPQKQHISFCPAETLHVYVIRGTSRRLASLLNKRRAPIPSLYWFQIHVVAVLRPADYHQESSTTNRPIRSPRPGNCTADRNVTTGRRNFLPGDSRQPVQQQNFFIHIVRCRHRVTTSAK